MVLIGFVLDDTEYVSSPSPNSIVKLWISNVCDDIGANVNGRESLVSCWRTSNAWHVHDDVEKRKVV